MPNMSYCRFENTSGDLKDCLDAMEEAYNFDDMDLSDSETWALIYMYKTCKEFIIQVERLNSMAENPLDLT